LAGGGIVFGWSRVWVVPCLAATDVFLRGLIGLGSRVDRRQQMLWRAVVSCSAAAVMIAFASWAAAWFLDVADTTTMHFFAWVGRIGILC
jgi:hypothetical protein